MSELCETLKETGDDKAKIADLKTTNQKLEKDIENLKDQIQSQDKRQSGYEASIQTDDYVQSAQD